MQPLNTRAARAAQYLTPHQCQFCLRQFFAPRKVTGRPRLFCSKKYRQAGWRRGFVADSYIAINSDETAQKTVAASTASRPDFADRPWRIVAGPPLSASSFHCATLGGAEAVAAANRTNLRHWQIANKD